ncbi:GPP34 family phosphoprotein [Pseudonocardia nematodicida]|uniref:GPP34 family phosphoprotein n=1 Tax=Pseudonocardia nematodicida TaxID=1206997 RepID=A0ABV1K6Z1_9PSEU
MGDLLLSEELLLIALDDETGKPGTWFEKKNLHGALVCDLIETGAVTVDRKKLRPAQPPTHPVLWQIYDKIAESKRDRSVSHWVTSGLPWTFSKPVELIGEKLVADGVLGHEEGRALGLFRTTRLPEADPGPERVLRERLRSVLVTGTEPGAHDALLITLLHAANQVKEALSGVDADQRKVGVKRAKQIAKELKDNPVVKAQYDAAMAAAVAAATTVAVTSGSN